MIATIAATWSVTVMHDCEEFKLWAQEPPDHRYHCHRTCVPPAGAPRPQPPPKPSPLTIRASTWSSAVLVTARTLLSVLCLLHLLGSHSVTASCPNYCNGLGTCGVGNTCICPEGFFGGDCSLSTLREKKARGNPLFFFVHELVPSRSPLGPLPDSPLDCLITHPSHAPHHSL
jgi:hypothetical protein